MIVKKSGTTLILAALYILFSAHEFWLDPDKFIYKRGEKINVRFYAGENFIGENWSGNKDRIESLHLYFGGVNDDLSKQLTDAAGDSLEMVLLDEGTYLVAFNSNNALIELPAPEFNQYLSEQGLNDILKKRKLNNETDSIGLEYYQRCAKTLFQVGNLKDRTYNIKTKLALDIIPLSNPYLINGQDSLRLKILFNNEPLPGSPVNIRHKVEDSTQSARLITDENGEIVFSVSGTGKWMISTVVMEEYKGPQKALTVSQWQSYWGTLTWGYL